MAVCGEAAGDPAVIPILVGLGVEELSVSPTAVARVRALLDGWTRTPAAPSPTRALAAGSLAEVEAL